jgi:hypothetical protein
MSASPEDTGRTGDPVRHRRTFVLIPGAGGTAWYWHLVAPLLRALERDRLGVNADVLPGGHLIALSQPARLAGFLLGVDA